MKHDEIIENIIRLAEEYYAEPFNGAGGALHIVLDDGNLEDSHIAFCIDEAIKENDTKGFILGWNLLKLSKTKRKLVYENYDRYARSIQ